MADIHPKPKLFDEPCHFPGRKNPYYFGHAGLGLGYVLLEGQKIKEGAQTSDMGPGDPLRQGRFIQLLQGKGNSLLRQPMQQKILQPGEAFQDQERLILCIRCIEIGRQILGIRQQTLLSHQLNGMDDLLLGHSQNIRQIIHPGFRLIIPRLGDTSAGNQRFDNAFCIFPLLV